MRGQGHADTRPCGYKTTMALRMQPLGVGSPVNTDQFVLSVRHLLPSDSELIDVQHQTQQDAAEFLTSLLHLLRPHLTSYMSTTGSYYHAFKHGRSQNF